MNFPASHVLALAATLAAPAHAAAASAADRRALLDALRPEFAGQAGQPVRLVIERLTLDGGWALFEGAAVTPEGREIDWSKSKDCDTPYGKGKAFALLRKQGGAWHVNQAEFCPTEPPYWSPGQMHAFDHPCGLYEELTTGDGKPVDELCRQARAHSRKPS